MLTIEVPGWRALELEWLVLDVNGTVARDGWVHANVRDALAELSGSLRALAVTADTHGRGASVAGALGIEVRIINNGSEAERKARLVEELGAERVVAVGNGANDVAMLRAAALGICVMGPEGCAFDAAEAADILTRDVGDAIGLLTHPRRLAATLRR
ncbi:MAG: HAD family hydrolase [Coriobacteriia bacterium]|nr:HAD family hydrolase [Coriobacteriia bacterium]